MYTILSIADHGPRVLTNVVAFIGNYKLAVSEARRLNATKRYRYGLHTVYIAQRLPDGDGLVTCNNGAKMYYGEYVPDSMAVDEIISCGYGYDGGTP